MPPIFMGTGLKKLVIHIHYLYTATHLSVPVSTIPSNHINKREGKLRKELPGTGLFCPFIALIGQNCSANDNEQNKQNDDQHEGATTVAVSIITHLQFPPFHRFVVSYAWSNSVGKDKNGIQKKKAVSTERSFSGEGENSDRKEKSDIALGAFRKDNSDQWMITRPPVLSGCSSRKVFPSGFRDGKEGKGKNGEPKASITLFRTLFRLFSRVGNDRGLWNKFLAKIPIFALTIRGCKSIADEKHPPDARLEQRFRWARPVCHNHKELDLPALPASPAAHMNPARISIHSWQIPVMDRKGKYRLLRGHRKKVSTGVRTGSSTFPQLDIPSLGKSFTSTTSSINPECPPFHQSLMTIIWPRSLYFGDIAKAGAPWVPKKGPNFLSTGLSGLLTLSRVKRTGPLCFFQKANRLV